MKAIILCLFVFTYNLSHDLRLPNSIFAGEFPKSVFTRKRKVES